MTEQVQFEGRLDNPDLTGEQNRQIDNLQNINTLQLGREGVLTPKTTDVSLEIAAQAAKKIVDSPKDSSQPRRRPKQIDRRSLSPREKRIADQAPPHIVKELRGDI
jgi:hypothetical protein